MSGFKIQADYEQLSLVARTFSQHAAQTTQLFQQVSRIYSALASGDWTGTGATAFFEEVNSLVAPAMRRLTAVLDDAGSAALKIAQIFHDAEDEAGQLFYGDGSGYDTRESFMAVMRSGHAPSKIAKFINIMDVVEGRVPNIENGKDGWSLAGKTLSSMFLDHPIVKQTDSTCSAVAAINLIQFAGLEVYLNDSPVDWRKAGEKVYCSLVDQWVIQAYKDDIWRHEKKLIGKLSLEDIARRNRGLHTESVWVLITEHVSPSYNNKVKVSYIIPPEQAVKASKGEIDYAKFEDYEKEVPAAEKWLIDKLQSGNPLYVGMGWQSKSIRLGGHACNVLGVQLDKDGRLDNVLISTNWDSESAVAIIPGAYFVESWLKSTGGYAIYIEATKPAPVEPKLTK